MLGSTGGIVGLRCDILMLIFSSDGCVMVTVRYFSTFSSLFFFFGVEGRGDAG